MLQQPQPEDFVIATGETHSVQELLETAFSFAGLDWRKYVEIDSKLVRPAEVDCLCGDASKARKILGWRPEVNFQQLIKMMVESDLAALKLGRAGRPATAGA
jgi:GDPmannose 4,6-dehydratase